MTYCEMSCVQWVKDNEIESNSQHADVGYLRGYVVFSGSKIMKLKAIHNILYLNAVMTQLCSVGQR